MTASLTSENAQQTARTRSGFQLMATALAAGIAVVVAVFLAFAIYQDRAQQELRRQDMNSFLLSVGEATSFGVDTWMSSRVAIAENIVEDIEGASTPAEIEQALRNRISETSFIWTYYGETNGDYHIWPPDDELPADYDPRTRPWFHAALASGQPTLTEPYYDISTGVETITVAAPVYRSGELMGVVGADFSTETLSDVLSRTTLGGLGNAFLVTGEGRILAHPDRSVVTKTIGDLFPGAAPRINTDIQFVDVENAPQFVTFVRLPTLSGLDWHVGLAVDKKRAFADLAAFRMSAIIATIMAAALLVIVLGFVINQLLVQPLVGARRAADAANVAKSEFLASMSHEIRTPMNGVLGMADVLLNSGLNKRQRELASIIVSSGNALMTVINDILDFAKLEAGKLRLTPRPFNMRKMVYEVATMMQARALEKDLEMIVRFAPNLPDGVVADESRLRQVLGNLIGNAVKFTEHGYILIDVTGERNDDRVDLSISVKDTGIGIKPDEIERMFERFEQADGSHTRQFGGTGLGLAICKNVISLMNGEIGAESDYGEGSRFWFALSLPVDENIQSMPLASSVDFEGVRVLAVDDNEVNRRVLGELIDGWGFRSTIVADGVKAMAALERAETDEDPYDIIILDFQMPNEDGASLAQRLRRDARFAEIPVVILSSIDDALAKERSSQASVVAFLAKPVRPSQLMDTLAQIIADRAPIALRRMAEELIEPPASEEEKTARALKPEGAPKSKILIAEDNIVNQMVVTKFISDDAFDVAIAENGKTAVEKFEKDPPAMILMDLSMPVMDGLAATKRIREIEDAFGWPRTPIVATTAHVLDEDRERCRAAGMDDFLSKPIKKSALDAMVLKYLGKESRRLSA